MLVELISVAAVLFNASTFLLGIELHTGCNNIVVGDKSLNSGTSVLGMIFLTNVVGLYDSYAPSIRTILKFYWMSWDPHQSCWTLENSQTAWILGVAVVPLFFMWSIQHLTMFHRNLLVFLLLTRKFNCPFSMRQRQSTPYVQFLCNIYIYILRLLIWFHCRVPVFWPLYFPLVFQFYLSIYFIFFPLLLLCCSANFFSSSQGRAQSFIHVSVDCWLLLGWWLGCAAKSYCWELILVCIIYCVSSLFVPMLWWKIVDFNKKDNLFKLT